MICVCGIRFDQLRLEDFVTIHGRLVPRTAEAEERRAKSLQSNELGFCHSCSIVLDEEMITTSS